jgi:hypothetical protein
MVIAFLRLEIGFLLGGLLLVVIYQMLTGKINLNGLLTEGRTREISPARVQLLVLTLAGALFYIYKATTTPGGLPEIPQELLLFLGGSHIVYLGGKTYLKGE